MTKDRIRRKAVLCIGMRALYIKYAEATAKRENLLEEAAAADTKKSHLLAEKKRNQEIEDAIREAERIEQTKRRTENEEG